MLRGRKIAVLAAVAAAPAMALAGAGPAAGAETLRASLSGDREVPTRGDPNGSGSARITTDRARRRVCYRITLERVGVVTAGHIHKGRAGRAGDVVVGLFGEATRRPRGCVSGVARSLIRDIESHPRRYYVNVHNERYPAGAVRGQLRG